MTDTLKARLDALSEAAMGGTWSLERDHTFPFDPGNSGLDDVEFICTLVNAYRCGDLIVRGDNTFTREQVDQAVREAVEAAMSIAALKARDLSQDARNRKAEMACVYVVKEIEKTLHNRGNGHE